MYTFVGVSLSLFRSGFQEANHIFFRRSHSDEEAENRRGIGQGFLSHGPTSCLISHVSLENSMEDKLGSLTSRLYICGHSTWEAVSSTATLKMY